MPGENKIILTDEEKKIIIETISKKAAEDRKKVNILSKLFAMAVVAMESIENPSQDTLDTKEKAENELKDKEILVTTYEKLRDWLIEQFA